MGTRGGRARNLRETPFRRAGAAPPPVVPPTARPLVKLLLLALGTVLLSLSFAPIKQFYLAPIGLVPWLVVLNSCRTRAKALLWSWLAGVLFFAANMWWLVYVTGLGTAALMIFLGLYWAATGWLIRGAGLLPGPDGWARTAGMERRRDGEIAGESDQPLAASRSDPARQSDSAGARDSLNRESRVLKPRSGEAFPHLRVALSVLGIAVAWVAVSEWLRATWPFGGLPWLFLGYTQTPFLPACQIADVTGVYGVSFCLAVVNGWAALFCINRFSTRRLVPAGAVALALVIGMLGYGCYRLSQHATYPGPTVLVVQSNFPQKNTGDKGAGPQELLDKHMEESDRALATYNGHVDMVVWSETMAPPIAEEVQSFWKGKAAEWSAHPDRFHAAVMQWARRLQDGWPQHLDELGEHLIIRAETPARASLRIAGLAHRYQTAFLVGAEYESDFSQDAPFVANDRRNSVFLFQPDGRLSEVRYDKTHLVPFGEYIPFQQTVPWLYRILISLGPPDMEGYQLHRGDATRHKVFTLPASGPDRRGPWWFVTPICFEDIDGPLVAWMFRPEMAGAPKRADFIVNLTNDGWFKANEMPQHLQAAVFRSIENRAPTARSVNTGISGFIDSDGGIDPNNVIPAGTEGSKAATLQLDRRTTLYTRWGDVFADICAAAAALMAVVGIIRYRLRRSERTAAH